jgi:hypothetical protein
MNLRKLEDLKRRIVKQTKSYWFAKTIVSLIIGILMFIPAYVLGLFWWILSPIGFWQVFALVVGWALFLGVFQIGFIVCGIILIIGVIIGEI